MGTPKSQRTLRCRIPSALMMRKLLIWGFVAATAGLWAWYLLDLQASKRVHGDLRQCITADVRAALVVYKPDELLSMMRESSVYQAMEDTSGWGRAMELMARFGNLRDESVKTEPTHPPLLILFYENGTAEAAMDAYYLKNPPKELHHGCALTAPSGAALMDEPTFDQAWRSTGGKFGTLLTRMAPAVLTDDMAAPAGWASLELDVADERWHMFGYVFHPAWALATADSSAAQTAPDQWETRGNTFAFGHYPTFLSALAQNASPEWTLRRNATEDSCQCAIRDLFDGWHTGLVEYWTGGDGAVLTFEIAAGVTEFPFSNPTPGEATQPPTALIWPSLPGVAFGLSDRFPVINRYKNTLSFATSARAFALYRNAKPLTVHRGAIENPDALRIISQNDPLMAPRSQELTATQALRFETPERTYVQWTIGIGSSAVKGQDNMLWLTDLAAAPASSFFAVTNHNTREKEILFQDSEDMLHMVGAGGKILWSIKADGRLMGAVTQVDVMKNGKLQLAFNTEKSLYILDRNGKPTEGFPVKLPSVASGPVGVFDYEQTKDYRLVVPLQDGQVMNFSAKGQPVKGWQYKKSPAPIVRVEHKVFGKNDFLVFVAADGEIKVLQRNGTPKLQAKGRAEGLGKNYVMRWENSIEDSYMIYQANDSLLRMTTVGQTGAEDLPTPGIYWKKWFYGPVNADSRADMMLISDNLCTLMLNGSESEILIPLSELPSSEPLIVQRPEGDNYIFFDQPKAGQIVAFKLNGEPVGGFPLEGNAPFTVVDLNLNGRLNVVVTGDGEVICYELK